MATADGDFMRHAAGFKVGKRKATHFNGVVNQLVVVGYAVEPEAVAFGSPFFAVCRFHRGRHAPFVECRALRRLNVDEAGRFFLAEYAQENTGAIEEGMRSVKVSAAHRVIPGVNFADDGQRCRFL